MDRIESLGKLKTLKNDKRSILIIHYSCESFYQKDDKFSPRIASICVKDYSNNQSRCFSITDDAEAKGITSPDIQNNYNDLEKSMLDSFFDYLGVNQTKSWIHWNMRGSNYGFQAIYHRYRILGGAPIILGESRMFDLAEILKSIYGSGYAPHPRLEKLCELNNLSMKDFLVGAEEAEAFERKDFSLLKMSTSRKVDLISDILSLQLERKLKKLGNVAMQRINEFSVNPFIVIFATSVTIVTGLYTIFQWVKS
jgi:hypothetical protein